MEVNKKHEQSLPISIDTLYVNHYLKNRLYLQGIFFQNKLTFFLLQNKIVLEN